MRSIGTPVMGQMCRRAYLSAMTTRPLIVLVIAPLAAAAWCGNERAGLGRARETNVCGDSAAVSWEPAAPREGALFRGVVRGVPAGTALSGNVAGEALHFASVANAQRAETFAAVPIDAGDSLGIQVYCTAGGQTDTLAAWLAATRGDYPVERLTVAPTFGREPDSVLAARIRRESERATAVA